MELGYKKSGVLLFHAGNEKFREGKLNEAIACYNLAIKYGEYRAYNQLGLIYMFRDKNYKMAFDCFRKAAIAEDSRGLFYRALCYKNGWGTNIDMQRAFNLFYLSSEKKNDYAKYELTSLLYEIAIGNCKVIEIPKRFAVTTAPKCIFGLVKEASKTSLIAKFMLAKLCLIGYGTKRDENAAKSYFKKAIESFQEENSMYSDKNKIYTGLENYYMGVIKDEGYPTDEKDIDLYIKNQLEPNKKANDIFDNRPGEAFNSSNPVDPEEIEQPKSVVKESVSTQQAQKNKSGAENRISDVVSKQETQESRIDVKKVVKSEPKILDESDSKSQISKEVESHSDKVTKKNEMSKVAPKTKKEEGGQTGSAQNKTLFRTKSFLAQKPISKRKRKLEEDVQKVINAQNAKQKIEPIKNQKGKKNKQNEDEAWDSFAKELRNEEEKTKTEIESIISCLKPEENKADKFLFMLCKLIEDNTAKQKIVIHKVNEASEIYGCKDSIIETLSKYKVNDHAKALLSLMKICFGLEYNLAELNEVINLLHVIPEPVEVFEHNKIRVINDISIVAKVISLDIDDMDEFPCLQMDFIGICKMFIDHDKLKLILDNLLPKHTIDQFMCHELILYSIEQNEIEAVNYLSRKFKNEFYNAMFRVYTEKLFTESIMKFLAEYGTDKIMECLISNEVIDLNKEYDQTPYGEYLLSLTFCFGTINFNLARWLLRKEFELYPCVFSAVDAKVVLPKDIVELIMSRINIDSEDLSSIFLNCAQGFMNRANLISILEIYLGSRIDVQDVIASAMLKDYEKTEELTRQEFASKFTDLFTAEDFNIDWQKCVDCTMAVLSSYYLFGKNKEYVDNGKYDIDESFLNEFLGLTNKCEACLFHLSQRKSVRLSEIVEYVKKKYWDETKGDMLNNMLYMLLDIIDDRIKDEKDRKLFADLKASAIKRSKSYNDLSQAKLEKVNKPGKSASVK